MTPARLKKIRGEVEAIEMAGGLASSKSPALGVARELLTYVDELRAEIVERRAKTYCAYCGEATALDDDAATKVGEHIRRCPKHPIAEYRLRCAELEAQFAALTAERDAAVAAERAACAAACRNEAVNSPSDPYANACEACAEAIEARGGGR